MPEFDSNITVLIDRWQQGKSDALADLTHAAYPELRGIARRLIYRENPAHTLQATGLVNELFVRLTQVREKYFPDRIQFFSFAAYLMRLVLIDHARANRADKRNGARQRVPLHEDLVWVDSSSEEILSLSIALDELQALDARKAQIVSLRFFLGCTNQEIAEMLKLSLATVERDLQFSKAWLYRRLQPNSEGN